MRFNVIFVGFLTLCLKYCAMANSIEQFKLRFVKYILDCSAEFPISTADIVLMKQKQIPDDMNTKCLLACTYKKSGMMDSDGKLSVEGIKILANELFADNPVLIQKSEKFTQDCAFVNDEEINGDKKDCERARMIFKCSIENADRFNPAL